MPLKSLDPGKIVIVVIFVLFYLRLFMLPREENEA